MTSLAQSEDERMGTQQPAYRALEKSGVKIANYQHNIHLLTQRLWDHLFLLSPPQTNKCLLALSSSPSCTTTFLPSALLHHPHCQIERGSLVLKRRGGRQKEQMQFGDWHKPWRVNNNVVVELQLTRNGWAWPSLSAAYPAATSTLWRHQHGCRCCMALGKGGCQHWLRPKVSLQPAKCTGQVITWMCVAFSPARSQKWASKANKLSTWPEMCHNGKNWSWRNQDGGNAGPETRITRPISCHSTSQTRDNDTHQQALI